MASWIRLQAEMSVSYLALFLLEEKMDFLKDDIKTVYFRCLAAAFGSSFITSVYGIVDMAVVGQYYGPNGTAALAIVTPVWNILYSMGLLAGIGGGVLFSTYKGIAGKDQNRAHEIFTSAFIGCILLALFGWLLLIFFEEELLVLFGAEETLMPLAQEYLFPVKFVVPVFLFTQFFSAFLRNDGNPGLATKAVIFGGIFNVFGDWFFVFALDMGIMGAGIATSLGAAISLIVMLTHFFSKKNSLRFRKPRHFVPSLGRIVAVGFSSFFIDIAMGILTVLFNRQIVKYLSTDALSVYGIIINISTLVQCCAYSIGQASQPIISVNLGANYSKRIRNMLKYALMTCAVFAIIWTALVELVPNIFVRIFMTPTENIMKIAPDIIRRYGISFLLLPFNIFSTYYFQAILKNAVSFIISVSRGMIISGILIYLLPILAGANAIWFAMPITEFIVAVYAVIMMRKCNLTTIQAKG